jgi:phage-related protein
MPLTFTFPASYGTSVTRAPRIKAVKFGDGYEQRQPDGINTFADVSIDSFFSGLYGVSYFLWTPPGGTQGKYICKEWGRTIATAVTETVTATFQRVFDL